MAKIWQINETFTQNETIGWSVEFTSNGRNFISLGCETNLMYGYTNTSGQTELLYLTTPSNGIHTWRDPNTGEDTSAYRTVTFETEPTGDLLAWLQANAVAQDQPAVTTTRVLYKGKKELTMAQFEALTNLDDAVDYDITDFPNGGITNAQMTAALGYSRLFADGEIYVCSDNGTYTKGHTYQVKVTGGVKSWEDITPESTPSTGTNIQVTELPPASAENVGKIVQFMTERNDIFLPEPKQGHWYKCQPVVAEEGRYEWVKQSVQDKDYIIKTSNDIYDPYTENIGRMVYDDPDRKIVWNPIIALGELTQLVDYQGNITVNYTIGDNLNKSQEMRWDASIEGWSGNFGEGFFYIQKEARLFSSETLTKPLYAGLYLANDLVSTYPKITVTSIALANGTSITIPTGYGEAKFYNYSLGTQYSSPIDFADKHNFGSLTDADIEAFRFEAGNSVQDVKFDINKLKIQNESGLKPLKDYLVDLQNYVPKQSEAEPVALTWIINEKPSIIATGLIETPKFTIKGVTKDKLYGQSDNVFTILEYYYDQYLCAVVSRAELGKEFTIYNYSTEQWANQDYRTLMFETAPTGNLLEWLQSNAVPQSSSTKTYAQVTNENGAVSIRVFENSDADLQNLSITKDGVTINGKKPLTSVKPLYKHELVIPYSFSVGDSETVNGSAIYHYLSNTGTQITSASEIDDNFMLSGGIGKNSANTAASQSESTALTWQLNDTLTLFGMETKQFDINFISNNQSFKAMYFTLGASPIMRYLTDVDTQSGITPYSENFKWMGEDDTDHSAYRTVTFETAPSGELLTWLQANAVPQGGADSSTVLLFNVNVTKAGSSITVEAVNASTMGYITGTVGTITDTVTQLI